MKINVFSERLSDRLLQQCAEIWVTCFTGPPRFENWTIESATEELQKYLTQRGDFILAMPGEDSVAAFAVGLPVTDHYGGADLIAAGAHPQSYYFVALGTRPELRRQGLGAALHKRREEEGIKRGYSVMTVRVRSDNDDNLRLLERAGFTESGRYQASIGESIAERLIMTKFVKAGVTDS